MHSGCRYLFFWRFWVAIIFASMMLSPSSILADTISLKPTQIYGQKIQDFTFRNSRIEADSLMIIQSKGQSLAGLLQNFPGLHVKKYGLGGIANFTYRGGSASQTAIVWEGMNLNDLLNGATNLAQVPGFFFDKVALQKGANSSLLGSGAMNASIILNQNNQFNRGFRTGYYASIGSFSDYENGFKVHFSNTKLLTDWRFFVKNAENNFPYVNHFLSDERIYRMQNAGMSQRGFMGKNAIQLGSRLRLDFNLWYLYASNNIQEALTSMNGLQSSMDNENLRLSFKAFYYLQHMKITFQHAQNYGFMLYYDDGLQENFVHRSQQYIQKLDFKYSKSKAHSFFLGLQQNTEKAISKSLVEDAHSSKIALLTSYKWKSERDVSLILDGRLEYFNTHWNPLSYGLKFQKIWKPSLVIYASYSTAYRNPTFNDLFWSGVGSRGNPDLKAEQLWTQDLGYSGSWIFHKSILRFRTNSYASYTANRIMWLPENGVWTPQNFDETSAVGLETNLAYYYKINKNNRLDLNVSYDFNRTVILNDSIDFFQVNKGLQMMYQPQNQFSVSLGFRHKKFNVQFSNHYNSLVWTNLDHNDYLDGYSITDMMVVQSLAFRKFEIDLLASLENILNVEYYRVPNYALPGRVFKLSINIKFHSHEK